MQLIRIIVHHVNWAPSIPGAVHCTHTLQYSYKNFVRKWHTQLLHCRQRRRLDRGRTSFGAGTDASPLVGAGAAASPPLGAGTAASPLVGAGAAASPLVGAGAASPLLSTGAAASPLVGAHDEDVRVPEILQPHALCCSGH